MKGKKTYEFPEMVIQNILCEDVLTISIASAWDDGNDNIFDVDGTRGGR